MPAYFSECHSYPCDIGVQKDWFLLYYKAPEATRWMDYELYHGMSTWIVYDANTPQYHFKPGDYIRVMGYKEGKKNIFNTIILH